jgi:hypothetical protein
VCHRYCFEERDKDKLIRHYAHRIRQLGETVTITDLV